MNQQRCGSIALIGAPNAGKSTLLNALVGDKVSIVSPKAQTTRITTRGILTEGDTQLVFIDTPGIFAKTGARQLRPLERQMLQTAWDAVQKADAIMLLVDVQKSQDPATQAILAQLKRRAVTNIALVLNKIDTIAKPALFALAETLHREGIFTDVFMIAALKNDGVAGLKQHLLAKAPRAPWLYPADQLSDMSERLLAAEITREQLFLRLHKELPYSLSVITDSWEQFKNGTIKIHQTIYVSKASHKPIVLGKAGANLRQLGAAARRELGSLLGVKIHLFLFVKTDPRWLAAPDNYIGSTHSL